MSAKILISALANSGKTTLLKSLNNVLVIAHDGKKYPFPQPHVNVDSFNSMDEFIGLCNSKVAAYKDKFGELPETMAFDSVSKIFETIADYCNEKFTGFNVYSNLNKEVHKFTDYIENTLITNGINVVIVSHAVWDADTTTYQLVAQGAFAKKGGFLSEVDQAVFVEVKSNKRTVHHRSNKFASRTTLDDMPDNEDANEYNLQAHIEKLVSVKDAVAEYIL